MKTLIDSSVWIEFFSGGDKTRQVEKYLKPPHKVLLPSIVSYEVYKKIKAERGEQMAVMLLAQMERLAQQQVALDQNRAIQAGDLSLKYKLPMADAIIYATAVDSNAVIVTMDAHFKDLPNVHFVS